MDTETYNQVCDICEEYTAMVQESEEQAGGEGFFREYLEEEPEEEDEDLEEEDSIHSESEEKSKKKRGRKAKTEDKKVVSDKKVGF